MESACPVGAAEICAWRKLI